MKIPEIPQGTNVIGVGIDQIEVSRIRDSLEKHGDHFLNKIFTSQERLIAWIRQILHPAWQPVLR